MIIIGHRAIYRITENEEHHDFYAHWGANVLSAIWRFSQASENAQEKGLPIHIGLEHLSSDGKYMEIDENKTAGDYSIKSDNPFCDKVSSENYIADFHKVEEYDIEMVATFDIDNNNLNIRHNPQYPYFTIDEINMPIDDAVKILDRIFAFAENNDIGGFYEVANLLADIIDFEYAVSLPTNPFQLEVLKEVLTSISKNNDSIDFYNSEFGKETRDKLDKHIDRKEKNEKSTER